MVSTQVGEPGIVAEVELLTAVATFFKRLGVGPDIVGIRVNSRKVLDVAITKAGVPRDKFEKVCVVVDKLDKIGAEAVKCMLTEDLSLPSQTADVILQCLQASSVDDLAKAVGLSQSDPAIAELKTLFELCKAYGVGDYLDFDASVVRGLAYYTGVVFEAFDRKGELRAICGGGRYDRLAELYGGEKCQIPFCGFGFGDCVVVELLKDYGLMPDASPSVDVVVAPFDATMQPHALKVASSLRKAGLSVDAALTACKARKAFDLANRQGARLVAFVAPGEWARGLVRVKDMSVKDPSTSEGLQVDVPFADLASVVSHLQQAASAKGAAWVSLGRAAPAAPTTQVGATLGTAGKLSLKATAKFSALAL